MRYSVEGISYADACNLLNALQDYHIEANQIHLMQQVCEEHGNSATQGLTMYAGLVLYPFEPLED